MRPRKQITVLGSFLTHRQSPEFAMAEELGYLLAQKGFAVLCGGHGGIAGPIASGVAKGRGLIRGTALAGSAFPGRTAKMNPLITETVPIHSIAERLEILSDSEGYIFFPGGIGTLAEYFFIWHSLQVAADFGRPVILLSQRWRHLLAEIRGKQMIKHKYFKMVHLCGEVKDAMALITKDFSMKYEDSGRTFFKSAIFFDLDGSIVESPEEVFISCCENRGYFFHTSDVREAFRQVDRLGFPPGETPSRFQAILGDLGITGWAAAGLAAEVSQDLNRLPRLHKDAVKSLHYFKEKGFSVGVLSSRPASQAQKILSHHSLSELFDFVGHVEPSLEKPLSRSLVEAFDASGISGNRIVHIADYFSGSYTGCRAAGVESILLDRYLAHTPGDETFSIRSPGELKYLLRFDSSA
jgi:predicted Rossmann-fold nucleotide-binding protein/FMN phosphatase YigB (HAD superfamily)